MNSFPLVKIVIPSRHNYSGYVQLFGQTHPMIPKGTVVHYKREDLRYFALLRRVIPISMLDLI